MIEKLEKELEKYQRDSDGFVCNKFLRKPLSKRKGFIYSKIDPETVYIRGGVFLPIWDSTDHLHFACKSCKTVADILAVRFDTNYSSKTKYALFIYLGCPGCGATGKRKSVLDIRDSAGEYTQTFSGDKLYFYGRKREPGRVVKTEKMGLLGGKFDAER